MQYIYTRSKLSPVILPMEASCLCWKEGWQLEDQVYDCSCQGCPLLGEVGILWASLCLFHFHQYCCQASLVKLVSSQTHFLKKKKGNNLEGVVTVHSITGHIYIGQILAMVVQEFMKTDILDTSGTYWEVMGHYSIKSRTVDRVTWKKHSFSSIPPCPTFCKTPQPRTAHLCLRWWQTLCFKNLLFSLRTWSLSTQTRCKTVVGTGSANYLLHTMRQFAYI